MDWQLLVGLGPAIVFGFLGYAVKEMPFSLTCGGIASGVLLMVWGLMPFHAKVPAIPGLFLVACIAGVVGGSVWIADTMGVLAPSALPTPTPQQIKETKIRMARRWIKLSDEILADLPMAKVQFNPPIFDKDMSQELRSRLWQQESQRSIEEFQNGLNRMSQRYLGRISEARMEMQAEGVLLSGPQNQLLNTPMINSFSWEAWATKLGGEGRHILTEIGEQQ